MRLTELQRHETLLELLPRLPHWRLAAPLVLPAPAATARSLDAPTEGVLARIARLPGHLARAWQRAGERKATIAQLEQLTPALLADIGIETADIEGVVDDMIARRERADAGLPGASRATVAAELVCRR